MCISFGHDFWNFTVKGWYSILLDSHHPIQDRVFLFFDFNHPSAHHNISLCAVLHDRTMRVVYLDFTIISPGKQLEMNLMNTFR